MTPQEAIKNIDDILDSPYLYDESIDYQLTTDDIECLEMAKEVLEKQIPKKVIHETEDDREFEDFICPCCKVTLQQRFKMKRRYFSSTIYKYKHCPDCSQALDWSDEE